MEPDTRPTQNPNRRRRTPVDDVILTTTRPKEGSPFDIELCGQPVSEIWDSIAFHLPVPISTGIERIVENSHPMEDAELLSKYISTDGEPTDIDRLIGTLLSPGVGGWSEYQQKEILDFLFDVSSKVYISLTHLNGLARLVITDEPIIVRVSDEFRKQRKSQRVEVCNFISNLAQGNKLYIVGTLYTQRWLANNHAVDLPGDLISQCKTNPTRRRPGSDEEQLVSDALEAFDPDKGIVTMLHDIGRRPTESATFDYLDSKYDVNRDTIHRRVNQLRKYGLLSDTFETENGKAVSITTVGRSYINAVYEKSGIQTTFEEQLIADGKWGHNKTCNPEGSRKGVGGGDRENSEESVDSTGRNRPRLPLLHTPNDVQKHRYAATKAVSEPNGITVTDTKITKETAVDLQDDRAGVGIYYDHTDDVALVDVEYDNPSAALVSIVNGLSHPKILHAILDEDRIRENPDVDFETLVSIGKVFLRRKRCLESLPNDVDGISDYRETLAERGQEILNMTRTLAYGEYHDDMSEAEYRGLIMKAAHGYIGTITHICDLTGVELIQQVKIPNYTKRKMSNRDAFVECLGKMCSIQSVYDHSTTQRQLYENRPQKIQQTIGIDVDPASPYSTLIPRISIVGDFGSKQGDFIDRLESELFEPREPRSDSAEIQFKTTVHTGASRHQYVQAITEMCREKNLRPTPMAVSVLSAICNTPYEATQALHWLEPNENVERIDAKDIRYTLSNLCSDDILKDLSGDYIQQLVLKLIKSTSPISQSELTDSVGISSRTFKKYIDTLMNVGLVSQNKCGNYRIRLSSPDDTEDKGELYPAYVVDSSKPAIHKAVQSIRYGWEHHNEVPVSDSEFPTVGGLKACTDLRHITDPDVWIGEILPLLWNIGGRDVYKQDPFVKSLLDQARTATKIGFGPRLPQSTVTAHA